VALLNNDAEAEPGWLAALASAFEGRPDVGMAASKILVHEDPARIDKVGHLIYPDGQNRGRGTGELDRGQYDRIEEVLWPDGCAAMYRRSMLDQIRLDQIGGFDEDFFAYADDAELGLRARIAGWKCLYMPGAVVRHHRGATLGLRSSRRLELIERNRVLLAVKLFPWSLLWLNGFYYAMRLGAGAWAALRGQGEVGKFPGLGGKLQAALALLKGDLAALRLIPRMLAKRRAMERIRKLSPREVRKLILEHRIPLKQLTRQAV
jgi:GT2 family glycosyltransferase